MDVGPRTSGKERQAYRQTVALLQARLYNRAAPLATQRWGIDRFQRGKDMGDALVDAWVDDDESNVTLGSKPKPVREWTVDDVAGLFVACGFRSAARVALECLIDGKAMLELADEDIMESVENEGPGLKRLQVRRVRSELLSAVCNRRLEKTNERCSGAFS